MYKNDEKETGQKIVERGIPHGSVMIWNLKRLFYKRILYFISCIIIFTAAYELLTFY